MVDAITDNYHAYNSKNTCEDLRATLHQMENTPGRVHLANFYRASTFGSQWQFAERIDFLRALGALDESVPNRPFLIIENYVTSRSNCLATSGVFAFCCRSDCEELMRHIELEIGAATATASDIAALVSNLSSATVDAPRQLSTELLSRLSQMAELHAGHIPLHGRLFAQWLHNAYPLECPYPHKEGSINPQTASEWINETGQDVRASEEDLLRHAAEEGCVVSASGIVDCGESASLSWDTEEELFVSTPVGERERTQLMFARPSSSRGRRMWIRACIVALAASMLVCLRLCRHTGQAVAGETRSLLLHDMKQPHVLFGLFFAVVFVAGLLNDGLALCFFIFFGAAVGLQEISAQRKIACNITCMEDCSMDKLV